MDMPEELQAHFDAGDPATTWPGENRSAVYRHCFEVRRREMEGRHWPAQESRRRAAAAYVADGLPVPDMPCGIAKR